MPTDGAFNVGNVLPTGRQSYTAAVKSIVT